VDIYETEKAYVLLADMPGVAADGLDVQTERNRLVIHGRVERPTVPSDYQEFGPEFLNRVGYDPVFGARPLKRAIQCEVETPVAWLIVAASCATAAPCGSTWSATNCASTRSRRPRGWRPRPERCRGGA
jgi:hypothetical protein